MSIRSLFPDTRPSLNLDFANTRALDPRVTFARASTATYYDGKTTHKAEENLVKYSQDFTNAQWTIRGFTVDSTSETAPDGSNTALKVTENNTNSNPAVYPIMLVPAGTYTISVWLKASENKSILLSTVGSVSSNQYVSVTTSWQRFNITQTTTSDSASGPHVGGFSTFGQGNGVTLYVWGMQLEQRSSVTAYTPTTSSPITRYSPTLLTAPINSPRFDHNPTTGESLGLLIEEQRTNLLLRSEEFDNVYWTKQDATITTNALIAPDGTLSADALIENTANVPHYIIRYFNQTTGYITLSVYAKSTNRNLHIGMWDGSAGGDSFVDLSNGSVISSSTGTTVVTNVGNGWYRISYTRNVASATGSPYFQLEPAIGSNRTYAGDGFSGIYLWGAQLEVGSFPTSYIPTTTSQATRLADTASMTGTNFSSWWNQGEGSFIMENTYGSFYNQPIAISDDVGNAWIYAMFTGEFRSYYVPYPSSTLITTGDILNTSTYYKFGASYSVTSGKSIYKNGTTSNSSTTTDLKPSSTLYLGRFASGYHINGYIKYLKYFPEKLTDTQLQSLTTP